MKKIFHFSKKAISMISMMLLFSLFAFPLTSCTQKSTYTADDTFNNCGVVAMQIENDVISVDMKTVFDPFEINSVTLVDGLYSSKGPYSIDNFFKLAKLSLLFEKRLQFDKCEKSFEESVPQGPIFIIEYKNQEKITVYYDSNSNLIISTDLSIYKCIDDSSVNKGTLINFINDNRR